LALSHSPSIVTDGLVLCLDAGNPKSYPGSGTTWTDLSGNGNNGTLVNGVGYSGSNLGSLVFDGSNDYVNWLGSDRGFDVELTNDNFKPLFTLTSTELPLNSWCCLGMRFKSDGSLSGFFNGIKKNTVTKSIGPTNSGNFLIGTDNAVYGGGSISCIQLYNRALSDTEIQQNYNALKGRFQ
jgi:hypothetical protein